MTRTVFLSWEMSTHPPHIITILNEDIIEYTMAGRLESFSSSSMQLSEGEVPALSAVNLQCWTGPK